MTNSIEEIQDAECIFVIGSNTTSSHPLVAARIFRAKQKGAKLVVADPRKIQLAYEADLYMRQNLGSDAALINGLMHVILKNNWHDADFIEARTEGFEETRKVIEAYTPEKAAEITGVPAEDIVKAAEYFGTAETATIIYCMGITQHVTGVDNVKSLANLAMLTGNVGRESTGVNPLRGQNNVQGACDMGGLPNVYPGYQPVTTIDAQKKFSDAWKAELSDKIGRTIPEMLDGIDEGSVKGLYIIGENPVQSDPDMHHVKKVLSKTELLVVQDIFMTPTAELAHVVLPGACFAEKDGTFSNTERRVTRVRKAVDPPGDARADWEIICDISNRFGYEMNYESPAAVMEEIASLTPSYGGIFYDRLESEGIQWPCPDRDHPGTKFLHKDAFARGKGLFHPIEYKPPAEVVDDEYPYWLTSGRVFAHYHTSTMSRNCPTLDAEVREGFLELNPNDADALGVVEGDEVRIASRRGELNVRTTITDRVDKGVLFLPFHFLESNVNILTNTALDPIAKIPELKVCAVKLEKAA